MIWTTLALAMTPADLEAARPDARAQLERCDEAGCTPHQGGRASFVEALGTYVETGVADARLAADVRVLAPELFDDLPDVLQKAAREPSDWVSGANRWAGNCPAVFDAEFDEGKPYIPPLMTSTPGIDLTIQNPDGTALPSAWFKVGSETCDHWSAFFTSAVFLNGEWAGRTPRWFEPEDIVKLKVWAPGHATQTLKIMVAKKRRRNHHTIVLEPLVLPAPEDALGKAAVAAMEEWISLSDKAAVDGNVLAMHRADRARLRAARAGSRWAHTGSQAGYELCLSTQLLTTCGSPPKP